MTDTPRKLPPVWIHFDAMTLEVLHAFDSAEHAEQSRSMIGNENDLYLEYVPRESVCSLGAKYPPVVHCRDCKHSAHARPKMQWIRSGREEVLMHEDGTCIAYVRKVGTKIENFCYLDRYVSQAKTMKQVKLELEDRAHD